MSKRDALLAQRQKLKEEKEKAEAELKQAQEQHGDTVEIQKRLDTINLQMDNSAKEALDMVSAKLDTLAASSGDKTAQITAREARVADREAAVTAREKDVDKKLANELAALRDTVNAKCGGETIIQQVAAPPPPANGGAGRSKKDIDERLKHARDAMYKRGILAADLPGPAQGLEGEASHAVAENDLGKAYALANQFALQVDAIRVDAVFIRGKIARMQAQVKSSKVDDATQGQLAETLRGVMDDYGNQKYDQANVRLNAMASKLK